MFEQNVFLIKQFVTSSQEKLIPLTAWCLVAMVVSWTDSRPVWYMTRVLKLTCVNWARFHGNWWAPSRKGFELHWNLIATKISCVNGPLGKRADTEEIKFPRKNGQRYVHLVNEFLFTLFAFDRSFAFACLCFLLVWNITPVKLLFSWKLLKLCVI